MTFFQPPEQQGPPQAFREQQAHTYPQQQLIYQQVVRRPANGLAITSMILGLVAIVFGVWAPVPFIGILIAMFVGPISVVGVVLGHLGLVGSRRLGAGRGQAIAGLVLNYIVLGLILAATILWFVAFVGSAGSAAVSSTY